MITGIVQDRYGFMWFATKDGLNRYDGYHFVVYSHDAADHASLAESYVQTLYEDSKGRLWIGTVSAGLDLFDRETETFIHIRHRDDNAASLSAGPVYAIAEDKQGNIWVKVSDKLDKITVHSKESKKKETFFIQHMNLPANATYSFLFSTKVGKIYYINEDDGVIYTPEDEKTGKWSVALNVNYCLQQQNKKLRNDHRIVQLVEDTLQGKFYVFCRGGVVCVNEKTGVPEKVFYNDFFKNAASTWGAAIDKDGIVWFPGTKNLALFNTHTGQITYATAREPENAMALANKDITFIDSNGLLWIGTSGYGLLKRNTRSEAFHRINTSAVYLIRELDNGNVSVGDNTRRSKVFDKSKGKFMAGTAGEKSKNDLENSRVFSFAPVEDNKKYAWYSDSKRLLCYNKIKRNCTYYLLPVTSKNASEDLIHCNMMDTGGNIWVGTTQGLLRFGLTDTSWKVYQNKPGDTSSLSSNVIYSLCLDPLQPKKYLWVGTGGSGLNRMDMNTGGCTFYSIKDGLPNNVIYGILNDDDGNLWMSTNKGLSCFNPQKQTFRNFDYKDGLQSNEFNRGAYLRTKDGCLFFGGVNGFNYFYPREILDNMTVPQIVITGLKIRNQPVPVQPNGSPLTKVIYLTKKLTLTYGQNFVSFEFASMDFIYPEKNLYQYKLLGFEKDWIHSGNIHSATYTNLNPGTYTFIVRGSNNDGVWNDKGTSVQLIILPPWYVTWWFRTAVALAFLLTAWAFYRYRLAQALKLQSVRDRIADDLHDEVGSNLSNIYIFSNVAHQKATSNADTAPLLQKISEYTRQSMEAMNDIVWMINTRNDRFENIMVRMRTLAAEFFETSDCKLHLDFDENLNEVKLNMQERKNFYLIYKEAINNTAKYAACKSLWVEMKLNQHMITLKIRDNGKGFDMANTDKGNGLFNMKKRAEMLKGTLTLTSTIGEGTTLQLSFKV